MKKYIYIACSVILAILIAWAAIATHNSRKYKDLYSKELQNVAAYQVANSGLEGEIIQHKMTINELYASKDSLDKALVSTMNELEISGKKVKDLQYQLKHATRTDTITVHDTILQKGTDIDTTVGDNWYSLQLQLQYPSTIIATPTFTSEQYIYIYKKKEYVGGKSKCFIVNWFKKKYISTEVKVEEKSPYIQVQKQKFIEIDNNE